MNLMDRECKHPECKNLAIINDEAVYGCGDCCSRSCSTGYRNILNWKDEEYRSYMEKVTSENLTQARKIRWEDPEASKRQSEVLRNLNYQWWSDPEYVKKKWDETWGNEEFRTAHSNRLTARNLERWKDPEYAEYMSNILYEAVQRNINDPEYIKYRSDLGKEKFSNPEYVDYLVSCGFGQNYRGIYESIRYKKSFPYRSEYELEAYQDLELREDLITYEVEPFYINYDWVDEEGSVSSHRYYPDILIQYENEKVLVEIKPHKFMMDEVNILKYKAAIEYCKNNSIDRFEVWTENNWPNEELYSYNKNYITKILENE